MTEAIRIDWDTASQLLTVLGEFEKSKQAGEEVTFDEGVTKVAAAFGIEDVEGAAKDIFEGGIGTAFGEDSATEIARVMAGMCLPIGRCVAKYASGKSDPVELMESLNEIYSGNAEQLESILGQALGFDIPPEFKPFMEKYSIQAFSVYCFAAAYKIYCQAAEDARLARERRIEIERMCEESIAQMKTRRGELEALVDGYLLKNVGAFSAGVEAMDRAVLENDDDGYIAAHAELWQLFGRETQYRNAEEFDELMFSDETFRL